MLAYMTASEAAEKWNISHRRVITLCQEDRIPDVAMLGNMWIIPNDATKPADGRTTRYENKNPAKPFIKWAGGKVLDGADAQDEQHHHNQQGRDGCVQAAGHGLPDTGIHNLRKGRAGVQTLVFTHTVKDHDGGVNGIAQNGQCRR